MKKNKAIFIAGTGTGVGKTRITGLLAHFFQKLGYQVATQKWVQSGISETPPHSDVEAHYMWMKQPLPSAILYKAMCPYQFPFPAAPHLSAAQSGKTISREKILTCYSSLKKQMDILFVEGTGGLMMPYNDHAHFLDIMTDLQIPTVLVVKNELGCINHSLLTLEALKVRGIPILGLLFNQTETEAAPLILQDNPKIIQKQSGIKSLGVMPYTTKIELAYDVIQPIAQQLQQALEL